MTDPVSVQIFLFFCFLDSQYKVNKLRRDSARSVSIGTSVFKTAATHVLFLAMTN